MKIDIQTGNIYLSPYAYVEPFIQDKDFISQFPKSKLYIVIVQGTGNILLKDPPVSELGEVFATIIGVRDGKVCGAGFRVYPSYEVYMNPSSPKRSKADSQKYIDDYILRTLGRPLPHSYLWGEIYSSPDRDDDLPYLTVKYR